MKYLLLLILLLAGCTFPPTGKDFAYELQPIEWTAEHIEYRYDMDEWNVRDYWQTPDETLDLRTGDCEDHVILDMQFLWEIGIDSLMVSIPNHVVLQVEDRYYETITGRRIDKPDGIEGRYTFEEVRQIVGWYF